MHETHAGALLIPPAAEFDPKAREIARIWAAGGAQHVSLQTRLWDDPAAWGIALVDLARHAADAYQELEGMPASDSLERIRRAFDAEWAHPTDRPKGRVLSSGA